jgi:hypothetical protein
VVNEVLERIDIGALERSYKGGGASSYHPRMLLKVLVYAYLKNIYSSRKIEQALCENVHFMWLAGGAKPDHNTISDFRSKRLKEHLKKVFNQVVVRGPCHKAADDRILQRSPNLIRHRQKIKQLLESDEGLEKRRQRWKVEAVFGNIKQNKGFRRFMLRGLEKVTTEIGLIAIAHNLQRFSLNPAI